ncbi:MAG: hypothetical protein ACE5GA_07320 [Candidatus Zixiibacteriota bacterium]
MRDVISKRTCTLLYAFIASQPLPILLWMADQALGVFDVSRGALFFFLALPWGLAVMTALSALAELGFNTGRIWVRWALSLALITGVQFYALKEIYLDMIVPVNFIVFPLLALGLSHYFLRGQTR